MCVQDGYCSLAAAFLEAAALPGVLAGLAFRVPLRGFKFADLTVGFFAPSSQRIMSA